MAVAFLKQAPRTCPAYDVCVQFYYRLSFELSRSAVPLLPPPSYTPPLKLLRNGHLATIWPTLLRRVSGVIYDRERLATPDDDFLDLDWVRTGRARVAVVSHGLEGSTDRAYMRGMVRALSRAGWDVLAWNYRGCSGTLNRRLRTYHSGATDDLDLVVQHALGQGYPACALVGFSLGGNLTLKYLGEQSAAVDPRIQAAVVFSVPVDLGAASAVLDGPSAWLYRWRFLRTLRAKAVAKQRQFPDGLAHLDPAAITSLRAFDDAVTAPTHGFADAADYYARASSRPLLPAIRVPTLLVNAADDPFLAPSCFPHEEARASDVLYLEVPEYGGHVGFTAFDSEGLYWSERRAAVFLHSATATAEPVRLDGREAV